MSDYVDGVVAAVRDWDDRRPRSQQTEIGWSELDGCQAAVALSMRGDWTTDIPDSARAVQGTALHEWWTGVMARAYPERQYEVTTLYRGVPGHADEVNPAEPSVTDLKTKTLKACQRLRQVPAAARRDHPYWRGMLIQVNGYYAGLEQIGMLPPDGLVRLLFIPVDGKFSDWFEHTEPYDRSIADQAVDRKEAIAEEVAAGRIPPCDQNLAFCAGWCAYYTIRPTPIDEEPRA